MKIGMLIYGHSFHFIFLHFGKIEQYLKLKLLTINLLGNY